MVTTANRKQPVPFIADQKLIVLKKKSDEASIEEKWRWLQPQTFRWRRNEKENQKPEFALSEHWDWEEPAADESADHRRRLLTDLTQRLMVITDNAGRGKTVSAEQVQYLLHQTHPGHLCLLVDFAALPARVDDYFGHIPEQSKFVEWFRSTAATAAADINAVARLIDQRLRSGQFTLVIDAFDQTDPDKTITSQAEALNQLLIRHPSLRCVCTGRPTTIIDQFWGPLFSRDEWLFVQVSEFDAEQAQRMVGEKRWKHLEKVKAKDLLVPRSLEAIRRIPIENLSGLRTASQVYWRSLTHTLDSARINQNSERLRSADGTWTLETIDALLLFALLGFECNRQGYLNGVSSGEPFRLFLDVLWKRHKDLLQDELGIISKRHLREQLKILARLNAEIDFAALDHSGISQVIFQSRTLQDFFAALWMCNYASAADRAWFASQRYVRWDAKTHTHYQMWKLACQMPNEPHGSMLSRLDTYYVKAMASLFQPSKVDEPAGRSAEMMWHCWPNMLQIAANSTTIQSETDVLQTTRELQREVAAGGTTESASVPRDKDRPGKAQQRAKEILQGFLGEYDKRRREGEGSETGRLCAEFENWFVQIQPDEAHWKDGVEGVDPRVLSEVKMPYRMAKYTLTNGLFRLFDPSLDERYEAVGEEFGFNLAKYAARPRVPVVAIDWFDAWVVALWFGSELPCEWQWEYACRAGSRADYSVGNGKELTKGDARFDLRWSDLATEVDAFKIGNRWGLYQMHGNVWEWCANWYDENEAFRSVRGGAFHDLPQYCRSGSRGRGNPADSDHDYGVRLSSSFRMAV